MIRPINKNDPFFKAFADQRHNAARRRVPFKFDFWIWKAWWEATGHWDERGKGADRYVMARLGDTGPYAPDNVKCITNRENHSEANAGIARNPCGFNGRKKAPQAFASEAKVQL